MDSYEIMQMCIQKPGMLLFVPEELQTEELCMATLMVNPKAIIYVKHPTPAMLE